ncbi:non-hydrolyzing UDP-N-acetylglucosamine 2-epimerase [Larkinella bovis]|uniref:Non-hydrolyzing UDP-N-acetylglucosamine 2-epimerase n=1 Tax=Larkinella bovis TaxID=683041 RepID=A0ABW0IJ48_9BACT
MSRAIKNKFSSAIQEIIVHTGQHYDPQMSAVFFDELQIPKPDYNLNVGSGKHGAQTAKMIEGIEDILEQEKPDYLIIYGDTNSTLAAAVAASKMKTPIVHIEAGLRSFNKRMPEEINRILSDHVATYLFPPTETGFINLINEGFKAGTQPPYTADNPGIFNVGDVMYDNTLFFSAVAERNTTILAKYDLAADGYVLATLHRNANTDDPSRLNALFWAFQRLVDRFATRIVLPLHPRTVKQMELLLDATLLQTVRNHPQILLLPPVSFLEMIQLEKNANLILTDSGGVQKEAYFLNKPCIILRSETEWVEIVESGAALLCDADENRIFQAYEYFEKKTPVVYQKMYGDGHAAEKMLEILLEGLSFNEASV